MFARSSIARVSTRAVARRQMSSEAKVHSKEGWAELLKTRPPKDHGDEHVSLKRGMVEEESCCLADEKRRNKSVGKLRIEK